MRGVGCLEDPRDDRDAPLSTAGMMFAQTAPPSASVQRFMAPIPNQLSSSSCVGQAVRQAYHIAEYAERTARGISDPAPAVTSALGHYFNARAQYGREDVDSGTWLRAAMKGLTYFGALREADWPFAMDTINRRPPWRAYKAAFKTRGPHRYYRIFAEGDQRLEEIRRCIAAERGAVVLGTQVAKSFLDDNGPTVVDRPRADEELVGGHAMAVVAYQPGRFLLANSWGDNYRLHGCVWVTEEYIAWERTHDIWSLVL